MRILKISLCLALAFFSSCTIIQEYHFNKDFSGHTRLSIDMESMMQMMAGMDSTGSSNQSMKDSLDFIFTESAQKLMEMGLKNLEYGWESDSYVLYMSYDFDHIDLLNKALNVSNTQNAGLNKVIRDKPHTYFTRKGKTLYYKGLKSDKDSLNSDMESMNDYYLHTLRFTFDRKIKKVDNPNATLSPDKKKLELSGSMFKMIRPGFMSDITFKLK